MNEPQNWERGVLEGIADNFFKEQRKERFWRIFFKVLFFGWLFLLVYLLFSHSSDDMWNTEEKSEQKEHVAQVNISGIIMEDEDSSAPAVIKALNSAFDNERSKAIILRINTPGGSPVHAGIIHDEIFRLREKYPEKKVYAVVMDMCLSAGYYIASAAHQIYADKASLVGSIGVLVNGFGFSEAIKKLGVERRLLTAGENKGILDPFSPAKPFDLAFMQESLDVVHRQFIDSVKKGRQDRIKNYENVTTGLFWTGSQALELGLIDGLGSRNYVARDIIGIKKIVDYSTEKSWYDEFAKQFGASVSSAFMESLGVNKSSMMQ